MPIITANLMPICTDFASIKSLLGGEHRRFSNVWTMRSDALHMKVKKLEPRVEVWKCPGIKQPMARHQVASGKCKGNSGRTVPQQKHEEEHPHSEVGVAGKTW